MPIRFVTVKTLYSQMDSHSRIKLIFIRLVTNLISYTIELQIQFSLECKLHPNSYPKSAQTYPNVITHLKTNPIKILKYAKSGISQSVQPLRRPIEPYLPNTIIPPRYISANSIMAESKVTKTHRTSRNLVVRRQRGRKEDFGQQSAEH